MTKKATFLVRIEEGFEEYVKHLSSTLGHADHGFLIKKAVDISYNWPVLDRVKKLPASQMSYHRFDEHCNFLTGQR